MKILLPAFFLTISVAASAQPVVPAIPARAQTQIDHLFDYIARSSCQFNRNGSWHDMASAKAHVDTKYQYLKERGQIDSAESFIDNAATKSSFSGKDYLVQCPGANAVDSGSWLKAELARFRQG